MLYSSTLNEILTNVNTGVEYEIALFYCLLKNEQEKEQVKSSYKYRTDASKIEEIINKTSIDLIEQELRDRKLTYYDCSFETQNDAVGPADIVLFVVNASGDKSQIGLSVKYANTCTLNVTGMRFITLQDKNYLKSLLPQYTKMYIAEMQSKFGKVENWFRMRKPSTTTDSYIDLIRDAAIHNWPNVANKEELFDALFHADSPIEYWVYEYTNRNCILNPDPMKLDHSQVNEVEMKKHETSFVAFWLGNQRIGHMQVKFNNGFLEKCKKQHADEIVDGIKMSYGQPFGSWNFCVEK